MMNYLGKFLVFVHVALSLVALTWAAALFFLATDWGLKTPRVEATERVPSELDKRIAAVKQAVQARDLVLPGVKKAQDDLYAAMSRYAGNHRIYRNLLDQVRTGAGPLQLKEVKFANDAPVYGADIPGIDKSYAEYRKELLGKGGKSEDDPEALYNKLTVLNNQLRDMIQQNEKLTRALNGTDAAGKKVQLGLYDLLEHEAQMQTQIRFEKQYIEPQWAAALEQARAFEERRARLQDTLDRLRKALGNEQK